MEEPPRPRGVLERDAEPCRPGAPAAGSRSDGALTGLLRGIGRRLMGAPRPLLWGLVVGHASGIWMLSSMSEVGPESDSLVLAILANAAHAPLFGILGLWLAALLLPEEGGWARVTPGAALLVLGLVGLYGALDEWHQSFVPGRKSSSLDLMTDLVGGASMLWIVAYLGSPSRTEGGLLGRLALGTLLCLGAAALAVG